MEAGRADPYVALHALGNTGSDEALSVAERGLASEERPDVRRAAAFALRHVPGERAEADLLRALFDRDAEVRHRAMLALGERTLGPAAIAALVERLRGDPDARVRLAALRALGNVAIDEDVRRALEVASASDAEADVRRLARETLDLFAERS